MKRLFWVILAPALASLAACGGKSESAATPAVDSTAAAPAAAVADSTALTRADSAKLVAPAAPAVKRDTGKAGSNDYDQAIRPRFKIDEKTGKIDTIKRP